ncbi:MAG: hypothetical protein JXB23_10520 [Candidatus Aminicenantes bacterium]|nr:hypothetical protein [Candidatus Aminicenantes bacterium]
MVSIAFLGYGASGSFLIVFKKLRHVDSEKILSTTSLLFALSVLLSFLCVNAISFDFIRLSWDVWQILDVLLYYILLNIPFFFAGLTISTAISKTPAFVNEIYFADLLGAGTGTLLAVFIFLPKGDRGVMLFISFLALIASAFFGFKRKSLFKGILVSLMLAWTVLFITAPERLGFRISPFKGLPLALQYSEAEIVLTKWNSISRLDVLDSPAVRFAPGLSLTYQGELPRQLGLSIDGGELTAVTRFRDKDDPSLKFLPSLPSSLPYRWVEKPSVLLIEPKGGLDVLAAVANDAGQVKIIENNPLITEILRKELASFTGNLYNSGFLSVVTTNSRTAIRKEKDRYDLIVLSQTDVLGSSGTGLHGFGEKYLFTTESFINTFQRLSDKGIIGMTLYLLPPPRQELRVLSTWIAALERLGKNPKYHICALRSWGTLSYFIKKEPFADGDIRILKNFAEKNLFDLVYYPGIKPEEANRHNKFATALYFDYIRKLLSPSERTEFIDNYLFRISPVSDDRPFFNNDFKISNTKAIYESLGRKILPFLQGEFIVLLILIQAFILASVMIFLPLLSLKKTRIEMRGTILNVFFFFSLIGMGFMFVEITFIQKFILFLGHPLYSLSIILFSLLSSSGLGSLLSKRMLRKNVIVNLKRVLVVCGILIFISPILFSFLSKQAVGFPFVTRAIFAFICLYPVGFFMGFPFPAGIRLLEEKEKRLIPWAWATNAFSSVINSVLALLIAFWGGYTLVLVLAGFCYLLTIPFLHMSSAEKSKTTA